MDFYNRVNSELTPWINHYWIMDGELDEEREYEILPMDHCDIVIRISGEFSFKVDCEWKTPSDIFFQGIKTRPMYLKQRGYAKTIGISFKPWGVYGLINKSMDSFRDGIGDVFELNEKLAQDLCLFRSRFLKDGSFDGKGLEKILMEHIKISSKDQEAIGELRDYLNSDRDIEHFAGDRGISRRKLERNFSKYIGISPGKFNGIQKFEDASRELLYSHEVDMNDIVYEGEYYDQPHFNREFKKFSKKTPGRFKKEDAALKSAINFDND